MESLLHNRSQINLSNIDGYLSNFNVCELGWCQLSTYHSFLLLIFCLTRKRCDFLIWVKHNWIVNFYLFSISVSDCFTFLELCDINRVSIHWLIRVPSIWRLEMDDRFIFVFQERFCFGVIYGFCGHLLAFDITDFIFNQSSIHILYFELFNLQNGLILVL
jgi:hypothetical protein